MRGRRELDRGLWRCPRCGDQTIQTRKGADCGPCFVAGDGTVKLVPATRELVAPNSEVAEPRFLADDRAGRRAS